MLKILIGPSPPLPITPRIARLNQPAFGPYNGGETSLLGTNNGNPFRDYARDLTAS